MENSKVVQKYKSLFTEFCLLYEKYELSTETIKNELSEIDIFRVTTPIIGGFSTGKSSMINAVLGDNLLRMQITPETAIPTEICYGDNNRVTLLGNCGQKELSIEQFKEAEISAIDTNLVKIGYNNDFLQKIKTVAIVDMPGFDSGIALHNKAIDAYLPKSLAYLVTFSADEPVLKESIANFLKELKLHEVPVYIVITKCDKVTEKALEECKTFIKDNVQQMLGIGNVKIACVKAKRVKEIQEVQKIFLEIQEKSEQIFERSFSVKLKNATNLLEKYIVSRLNNKELSVSELDEKEREIKNNIDEMCLKIEKEKKLFDNQLKKCVDVIKVKISADLSASSSVLETMLLNGNDIKDKVNTIVRMSVTSGIKNEFEPKIQKYLRNITDVIDINVTFDNDIKLDGLRIVADNLVKGIIIKSIPVVLAAIGGIFGGPIGAVIGGALAILVETLFKSKHDQKRRELARQKVEGEIIPCIADEAGKCVETELVEYVAQINEEIQDSIKKQYEVMKKALEDIKKQREQEEQLQKAQFTELSSDLERVRGLASGI